MKKIPLILGLALISFAARAEHIVCGLTGEEDIIVNTATREVSVRNSKTSVSEALKVYRYEDTRQGPYSYKMQVGRPLSASAEISYYLTTRTESKKGGGRQLVMIITEWTDLYPMQNKTTCEVRE